MMRDERAHVAFDNEGRIDVVISQIAADRVLRSSRVWNRNAWARGVSVDGAAIAWLGRVEQLHPAIVYTMAEELH